MIHNEIIQQSKDCIAANKDFDIHNHDAEAIFLVEQYVPCSSAVVDKIIASRTCPETLSELTLWSANAHSNGGLILYSILPAPASNYTISDKILSKIQALEIDMEPFKNITISNVTRLNDEELTTLLQQARDTYPSYINFTGIGLLHPMPPTLADQLCVELIKLHTYILLGAQVVGVVSANSLQNPDYL